MGSAQVAQGSFEMGGIAHSDLEFKIRCLVLGGILGHVDVNDVGFRICQSGCHLG